jgi:hypothetical protein
MYKLDYDLQEYILLQYHKLLDILQHIFDWHMLCLEGILNLQHIQVDNLEVIRDNLVSKNRQLDY